MRSRVLLAIAFLVLAAAGCTEVDETVVVEVSTLVPSLVDADLAGQPVEAGLLPGDGTIQNVYFRDVQLLDVTIDEFNADMTLGEGDCQFFDAWNERPVAVGKCGAGLIVDGDRQDHAISLLARIGSVTVQRVPPPDLPSGADYDADGVENDSDNCVLIDNPDQTDTGSKGYGDACTVFDFFLGFARLDSDGDEIPDSADNCPYTANPGQEDSGILLDGLTRTVRDGIGDACETETATVEGGITIELPLGPVTAILPFRQVRWLTLDLRDESSLSDCWPGGSCTLAPGAVRLCVDEAGGVGCATN